jgi:hypothetical protein
MTDEEINRIIFEQWGPVIDVPPAAHRAFARAIIAAHTAKLLAGVEMPESAIVERADDGSERDLFTTDQLHAYAAAAALNARREALEEAKKVCLDLMAPPSVGCLANANIYHDATEDCAAAIEQLKGKVC